MKTFTTADTVMPSKTATPWGGQLQQETCSICGNPSNEACCLLTHASYNSPETKVWGLACSCKRCSPYC